MGIKHATSKVHGDKGLASEWNDDHVVDDDVNFDKHEAQSLVLHNLAAPPAAPEIGQIYYNTVDKILYYWNGAAWESASETVPHTHADATEGGQLDWDNVWADAVHSHEAAGEGGQLDLFAVADATTKVRYLALNHALFRASNTAVENLAVATNRIVNLSGGVIAMRAGITLPHGAIITHAVVYGSNAAQSWTLYRKPVATAVAPTSMGTANINTEDSTITTATVDNSIYTYYFLAIASNADAIYGARITYTITADNQG